MPYLRQLILIASTVFLFFLSASCKRQESAQVKTLGINPGELTGYDGFNRRIQSRFLDPLADTTPAFTIGPFLGIGADIGNLKNLYGVFDGQFSSNTFLNGSPNSINMLLLHMSFANLSKSIAVSVDTGLFQSQANSPAFKLNSTIQGALKSIKEVTKSADKDRASIDQSLTDLWNASSGSVPPSKKDGERLAWLQFAKSTLNPGANETDLLSNLLYTLMMNPYFLVEQ